MMTISFQTSTAIVRVLLKLTTLVSLGYSWQLSQQRGNFLVLAFSPTATTTTTATTSQQVRHSSSHLSFGIFRNSDYCRTRFFSAKDDDDDDEVTNGSNDNNNGAMYVDETTADDNDFYVDDYDAMPLWRIEEVDTVFGGGGGHDDNEIGTTTTTTTTWYPNPLSLKNKIPSSWFVEPDVDAVAARVNVDVHQTCIIDQEAAAPAFVLAGPRKHIAFDPDLSRAAIVTCGGLCPGLNTVGTGVFLLLLVGC